MSEVQCRRCGRPGTRMAFQPFQNDLGRRAYEQICASCWGEWLRYQTQLINHYGLNVQDSAAKEFLFSNMEKFLFEDAPA